MKRIVAIISVSMLKINCKSESKVSNGVTVTKKESYELHSVANSTRVLVLFPSGGNSIEMTKEEFNIIPKAIQNDVSVLIMNFSRHIWIDETKTKKLASELDKIFTSNNLNRNNIYIGGMSIGGNVSLTLSNYLIQNKLSLQPNGTFIIDSPIDLNKLYQSCLKDIANPEFSKERIAEPKWIVNYFDNFWERDSILIKTQELSPYTLKTGRNNIKALKDIKLRMYTEPDSTWWEENRQTQYQNTNAYTIQKVSKELENENWSHLELIETKGKGYRKNGERHPHSWSIVDVDDLIKWIKE